METLAKTANNKLNGRVFSNLRQYRNTETGMIATGYLVFNRPLQNVAGPQLQVASFSLNDRLEPIKTPGTFTNSNRMTKSNYFS